MDEGGDKDEDEKNDIEDADEKNNKEDADESKGDEDLDKSDIITVEDNGEDFTVKKVTFLFVLFECPWCLSFVIFFILLTFEKNENRHKIYVVKIS